MIVVGCSPLSIRYDRPMLYLKCTMAVQKVVGLRKGDLTEAEASTTPLGNWYVHRFPIGRTHFFLFMSEASLLSFVLYQGKKPVTPETLPDMFLMGLHQLLAMKGCQASAIEQVMQGYREGFFSKTDSRKTLGCMSDLAHLYTAMVETAGGLAACDLTGIIMRLNDMPQRTLDWETSWDVVTRLLRSS